MISVIPLICDFALAADDIDDFAAYAVLIYDE